MDVIAHERVADAEDRLVDSPLPAGGSHAKLERFSELCHQASAALTVIRMNLGRQTGLPANAIVKSERTVVALELNRDDWSIADEAGKSPRIEPSELNDSSRRRDGIKSGRQRNGLEVRAWIEHARPAARKAVPEISTCLIKDLQAAGIRLAGPSHRCSRGERSRAEVSIDLLDPSRLEACCAQEPGDLRTLEMQLAANQGQEDRPPYFCDCYT